ncbi:hypothetical protein M8818_005847 [Zalaria obscura]|uniref:Uncharacterized protein n=1 Tax=Zalaria obscura TaxID=2024903 RepID=A0ACC3S7W3_9PEZI
MKYGHEYDQALATEGFPAEWVSSAISYRQLKKSIKRVRQELLDLGLNPDTLKNLPKSFGTRPLDGAKDSNSASKRFVPELWVALDDQSGQFLDAGLTDETKNFLRHIKLRRPSVGGRTISTTSDSDGGPEPTTPDSEVDEVPACLEHVRLPSDASEAGVRWIQIPLSTVTSFFDSLDPKLAELDRIQEAEEARLGALIVALGQAVWELTEPTEGRHGKFKPKTDVETWRNIFALYLDSTVFFSSHEQDSGSRKYLEAKSHLQKFSDTLVKEGMVKHFKTSQSKAAFDSFVTINLDILQAMRFQEINAEAVRKILKKFDKRTRLGAADVYQGQATSGPFAKSIAKDMCQELSSKIVNVVPQMDDWICPVCYSLAWRPIRLGCCNSVYCIRCVIQLQRDNEARCPMCRQPSVMAANQEHIDPKTAAYLLKYFPKEVKERQKANERAAGVDKYGEQFYKSNCSVM